MSTPATALGRHKLIGLLQRRLDLNLDAFSDHWRTVHKIEAQKLAHFYSAYVQNHRINAELPGFASACDGAPELWFQSLDDIAAMQTSDAYMTGAYIDEPNFMHGRAQGLLVADDVIDAGPVAIKDDNTVRVMLFIRRRDDRDADSFADWLREDRAPLAALAAAPLRHIRAQSISTPGDQPVFDAVESYWWRDVDTFKRAWGDGALTPIATAWISQRSCAGLLCTEHHVGWPEDGVDFGQ